MSRARRRSSQQSRSQSTSTSSSTAAAVAPPTTLGAPTADTTPFLESAAELLGDGVDVPSWSIDGAAGPEQAAVQRDGHISVNPEVAETGADLTSLMAHEVVHAAQANKSGETAPVSTLEQEADAGAEALMQGRPFRVEHAAAPGQVLAFDLRAWFDKEFGDKADAAEGDAPKASEAPAADAETEAPKSAPLGVQGESASKAEEGPSLWERAKGWAHSKTAAGKWEAKANATKGKDDSEVVLGDGVHEVAERKVGGEAKRKGDDPFADIQRRKVGAVSKGKGGDRTVEFHGSSGPEGRESHSVQSRTFEKGKLVAGKDTDEVFDVEATVRDARKALESRKGEHEAARGQVQADIDAVDGELRRKEKALQELGASPAEGEEANSDAGGGAAKKKALQKEIDALKQKRASRAKDKEALSKKITEVDQDSAKLASSPDALESVVKKHGVKVDKRYKKSTYERSEGFKKKDFKDIKTYTNPNLVHEDARKETLEEDGKKVVSSRNKERELNLKAGTFGVSESNSRVEERDRADFAGKDVTSRKTTKKTEVGAWGKDGPRIGRSKTDERKGINGSEYKASSNGKVSFKGGKLAADASSSKRVKDVHGNVSESERSGKISGDGASGKMSETDGIEGQHGSAKVKRSASGDFSVKVIPVKGDPPTYKLVTTITVGGEVAGELAAKKNGDAGRADAWKDGDGDASIKANGKLGAAATYTHSRVLSKADADAYLANVDKIDGGGKASGHPEFSFWAKAKAIAKEGTGASKLAAAVGGSDSAASMSEGDAFSLELSATAGAGVDGKVEGDGISVGAGGSVESSLKRTLSVSRGKGSTVRVSVSFSAAGEIKGNLSASSGMAKGGVAASKARSKGESVTFELSTDDPKYAEKYRTISQTLRPDTLRSLRETYKKDAVSLTRSKSRSDSLSGNVEVKGAKFTVGEKSSYNESVKTGKEGSSGSFKGSAGQGADVSVAGVKLAGADDQASIDAKVAEDGSVDIDLEKKSTENSLGLPDDLRMPLDLDEAKKLAKLKETVQKAETRLSGFRLSGNDLTALVGRAGDRNNWAKCGSLHPRSYGAWMSLAGQLRAPKADPEWAEVEPEQAKRLARARSLAVFAERTGTDGAKILENALRRWGQDTFGGNDPTGAALGEAYEWPPAISKHKAAFFKTAKDVSAFGAQLAQWAGETDGLKRELAAHAKIDESLVALQMAVLGCADFDEPAVRAEILRNLSTRRTAMRQHHADFMALWSAKHGTEVDEDALMVNDAGARVRDLHGILRSLKADETRMLNAVADELDDWIVDTNETLILLGRIDTSYTVWKKHVQELRTAYIAAQTPPEQHQVPGPGAASGGALMPDIDRYTKLKKKAYNHDDAKAAKAGEGSQLQRDAQRFAARRKELTGF